MPELATRLAVERGDIAILDNGVRDRIRFLADESEFKENDPRPGDAVPSIFRR
jgi:hypothetical protein